MKIDMHCHTREGSIDGKVPIEEYIRLLREKGFGGMVVTDHDSYDGYRYWKNNIKGDKYTDFKVFKGIEYDTLDAGHIIVIMPENIKMRLLELRGIPVNLLIPLVHNYGGILGPAHPCGEKFMSFMNAKAYKRNPDIIKEFDFIEIFNSCEPLQVNEKAAAVAEQYNLPGTGGSDSHKYDCVGLAYTEIPDEIERETQLIEFMKSGNKPVCGGSIYTNTSKGKLGKVKTILPYSFWVYNKLGGWTKAPKRSSKLKKGFIERVEKVGKHAKESQKEVRRETKKEISKEISKETSKETKQELKHEAK